MSAAIQSGMLRVTRDLRRYKVIARDGSCGRIQDFYFDDESWMVRYLVLDTGRWIPGRRVLVPATSLARASSVDEAITIDLCQDEIAELPDVDSDMPVSRQHVLRILSEMSERLPGPSSSLDALLPLEAVPAVTGDPHLQSVKEVLGYAVQANEGVVGQVDDFVIDVETWAVQYLAVDMRARGLGKHVVVAPDAVERISWLGVEVLLRMSEAAIAQGPELARVISLHPAELRVAGSVFASRDRHVS